MLLFFKLALAIDRVEPGTQLGGSGGAGRQEENLSRRIAWCKRRGERWDQDHVSTEMIVYTNIYIPVSTYRTILPLTN